MVSAFSVPKAKRQQKTPSHPGPGSYNAEEILRTVSRSDPKYSFGRQSRVHPSTLIPGPGAYHPHQHFIETKTPKYTMRSRQSQFQQKYNVGPGQYKPTLEALHSKSPSFSILGKKSYKTPLTPGPGHYQSKSQIENQSGYDFGKDSRLKNIQFRTPAPGDYNYEQSSIKYKSREQPHYRIGEKLQEKTYNTPSPNQYQPKRQTFSKIGGIVSHHLKSAFINTLTPGPGTYSTRLNTQQNSPKWSLPKEKRMQNSSKSTLGPGQYDEQKSFKRALEKSPSYVFGSSQKLKLSPPKFPGPGQYNSNYNISRNSPRMGQKKTINYDNKVPGPGAYESIKYDNLNWTRGKGQYTLGKEAKFTHRDSRIPGPGTYGQTIPLKKKLEKPSFSKDQRMKSSKQHSPGPGNYYIKPTFADVPKYLLP